MTKLHSFSFYALLAPVIMLGSGSVLAQQFTDQDVECEQQRTERDQNDRNTGVLVTEGAQGSKHPGQPDTQTAADHRNMREQARMQKRGYIDSAPTKGMQASNLIGAGVSTSADEDMGSVTDLIIDENGHIVAIVVGVGGFLGMGDRDVAIGWGDVTRSGASDKLKLRADVTRKRLQTAPEFKAED